MKSITRRHYGRIVLAHRELVRLQTLWGNVERPLCAARSSADPEPRPTGPAAALPASMLHQLWPRAA